MNESNIFKAKITTSRGTFEFEGNQDFVEKQIEKIVSIEKESPTPEAPSEAAKTAGSLKATQAGGSNPKKSVAEQPKMLPNLVTKEQITSVKEFYDSKKPGSHIETFATLAYWLKTSADHPEVSIDEMWTLYKVLQIRAPKVLIQTFRDGKSKKGYFESAKASGHYYLTTIGETFVEHDLPVISSTKH